MFECAVYYISLIHVSHSNFSLVSEAPAVCPDFASSSSTHFLHFPLSVLQETEKLS